MQHLFVAQTGLTRRLALELLDKMNNPDNHQSHFSQGDEDDLEVTHVTFVCMCVQMRMYERNGKLVCTSVNLLCLLVCESLCVNVRVSVYECEST